MKYSRHTIFSNFIWRFLERCGAQFVSLVVSIILARIISPSEYGDIALMMVFINILQVFVDSGFGTALIQKKDADDLDFSTVFSFNVVMCIAIYLLMFAAAPYIASFYGNIKMTNMLRVLSFLVVISGVKNIQQSYISKNMLFKNFFFATLSGTIVSAVVGIAMAYGGFGVWALIAQHLTNQFVGTVILWCTVKWRPGFKFSFDRFKGMAGFGFKLFLSGLLETIYTNLRQLILGKKYTSGDLAYYNKGHQFPNIIITNVNSSISSVIFPAMSSAQDDIEAVKSMTRKAITISTYIMAPMMMGLAFMSNNFIELLLTNKWAFAAPYLVVFCITYMFYPIHTANLNAIKAMGRSDIFLKLEIFKKISGVLILLTAMWFGPFAIACSAVISSISSQIINTWPNKKLLNYSYFEQLKDILPNILMAVVMGIFVYLVGYIKLPLILVVFIQIITGMIVYLALSILTKSQCFKYMLDIIKNFLKKKNNA